MVLQCQQPCVSGISLNVIASSSTCASWFCILAYCAKRSKFNLWGQIFYTYLHMHNIWILYMALWQKAYINTTYISTVSSESTSDWSVFCITVSDKVNMFPLWPYLQSNWISCFIYLPVWVTLYGFIALNQVLASSYSISVCFAFILLYVAVVHVETFFLPVSISDRKIILVKDNFSILIFWSWKCSIE